MIENLGERLKLLRINSKLSRKQAAELVGVSVSLIGLYETGERIPSLPVIMKLSAQYKVSVDYLLGNKVPIGKTISVEGLNEKQIQAVKQIVDCLREAPTE